jgi:FkbM family methyltransferase
MHNGVEIVEGCYYGAWMTEVIRSLRGHHEPQEEVVFHALLERLSGAGTPLMVELGAFWAYYSLWFLERYPGGRAVMVEPDPNYLAVGERNFVLNRRTGTFVQAAVGAPGAKMHPFVCESDGKVRTVPLLSFDDLVAEFGLDRIDLLLLDVQGAETDFLRGAVDRLADRVRFLVISTHHHAISGDPLTHQRCLELIRRAGGSVIAEHSVAESYSGDGMIAASFDPVDAGAHVEVSRARASESLFGDTSSELAELVEGLAAAAARIAELESANAALRSSNVELQERLGAISSTATWRLHTRLAVHPTLRRAMAAAGSWLRRGA